MGGGLLLFFFWVEGEPTLIRVGSQRCSIKVPPASGGAEGVGALRTTLLFGAPMVKKFQNPDTKMLTMSFPRISSP